MGGERTIKVYAFQTEGQGILEIEDSQEAKQEFVGGPLEEIPITDGFVAVCNENAFIENLEITAILLGEGDGEAFDMRGINHVIQGPFLVCRSDETGRLASITEEDVGTIRHYLKQAGRIRDGVIQIE